MKQAVYTFILLTFFNLGRAQNGTLDASFGNGGFVLTAPQLPPLAGQTFAKQCFVRADGKLDIVLFGNNTQITRRMSDGSIDHSYAYNGYSQIASLVPTCAAIQQDGKIVVAGSVNGSGNFVVVRYQINGSLDSSFGTNGILVTSIGSSPKFLNAVTISPLGKIIIGGISQSAIASQFIVAQITSTGTLDASFGTGGFVTSNFNGNSASVNSVTCQPDGKILAAGSVFGNTTDFALARYNTDGTPDLNFNTTGFVSSDYGFDDAAESVVTDGINIYVGGFSSDALGFEHFRIARYNSNGSVDATYNGGSVSPSFGDSHDVLLSMKLQTDGKLVAAGRTDLFSANNDVAVMRFNTDGSLDNNFGPSQNGLATGDFLGRADESIYLTFQPDGKILTGGNSSDFSTSNAFFFTCFRFSATGVLDAGFGTNGVLGDAEVYGYGSYNSLLGQVDGKVTAVNVDGNGVTTANFANRFKANGTPDSSFGVNGIKQIGTSTSSIYFQPDGKFLSIDFTNPQMTRYNSDGSLDGTFGTSGVVQLPNSGFPAFQPDGKILLGSFINTSDNKSDMMISRYNPNGSLDLNFGTGGFTQFNADTIDNVNSITVAPDGKIIIGNTGYIFPPDFSFFQAEVSVLRLNADGTPDANFGNGGLERVYRGDNDFIGTAMAQNDGKVLLTYFVLDNNSGVSNVHMERLNANGTTDAGFGQNGQTACDGFPFVLQSDQKIVVAGGVANSQNNGDFTLTRLNTDGSLDGSFGSNGKLTASFTGVDNGLLALSLSGNSLFAGGSGVDKTGTGYSIVAKFLLGPAGPIACPANKVVNTDPNKCSAKVIGIDPTLAQAGQTVKYKLSGSTSGAGNGSVSGKIFNEGVTTVTYTLASDKTKTCSFTVTVQDKQVPAINNFNVSPTTLTPPDHKMRDVNVNYSLADNCGIGNVKITVASNEAVQSNERGDQSPDWQILDNHHIKLREESLAGGTGRIYTITLNVTDINGNQTTTTGTVTVPKSNAGANCNLQVSASPNPSNDYFVVRVNSSCSDKVKLRLLDNRGNALTTMDNLSLPQTVKLGSGLHPGIYVVEVTQAGSVQSLQLVKQ